MLLLREPWQGFLAQVLSCVDCDLVERVVCLVLCHACHHSIILVSELSMVLAVELQCD